MLALDFLGVPFARTMHVGFEMAFVRPPMIRIKASEPEGLQQRFELQKDVVFAAPKDIRQDGPRMMLLGRRKARYPAARFHLLSPFQGFL